ncbi:MAG: hypothetical protein J6Y09_06050 [Lachnospiraceae bacterium]|nr:hypothetical protein [Lachnospiraceae bacterium]
MGRLPIETHSLNKGVDSQAFRTIRNPLLRSFSALCATITHLSKVPASQAHLQRSNSFFHASMRNCFFFSDTCE